MRFSRHVLVFAVPVLDAVAEPPLLADCTRLQIAPTRSMDAQVIPDTNLVLLGPAWSNSKFECIAQENWTKFGNVSSYIIKYTNHSRFQVKFHMQQFCSRLVTFELTSVGIAIMRACLIANYHRLELLLNSHSQVCRKCLNVCVEWMHYVGSGWRTCASELISSSDNHSWLQINLYTTYTLHNTELPGMVPTE